MDTTVTLAFRYLESDYVRALRAQVASQLRWPLDIAVAIVLAGIGAYFWRSEGMGWIVVACFGALSAFALLLVAGFIIVPWLACRYERKRFVDYSLTFSPEGIHFRTADIDSKLQWSLYIRALIVPHSYLLYSNARQFSVIPKRVFQSSEQQQAFEQLLTQNVSQIVRRGC